MNGKTFTSFDAVQASCKVNEDINDYGIESWLKSAKSLYKRAQIAQEGANLIDAYIYYTKTYEICYSGEFLNSISFMRYSSLRYTQSLQLQRMEEDLKRPRSCQGISNFQICKFPGLLVPDLTDE